MSKNKNIEPYTLICLYLQTLSAEELEQIEAQPESFCQSRFEAKVINKLEEQGMIEYNWLKMEVKLTSQGIQHAKALIKVISDR